MRRKGKHRKQYKGDIKIFILHADGSRQQKTVHTTWAWARVAARRMMTKGAVAHVTTVKKPGMSYFGKHP